jgi:hypothetical protein
MKSSHDTGTPLKESILENLHSDGSHSTIFVLSREISSYYEQA